jgi:hypothetical protein
MSAAVAIHASASVSLSLGHFRRSEVRETIETTLSERIIMKTLFDAKLITVATIILTSIHIVCAQETNATKEIEMTIQRYFAAMSARNVEDLRATLDKRFVVVEARPDKARTQVVDSGDARQILPPEGNHDWDKDKFKIASIRVEVSDTQPSVATASILVMRPLDDRTVAGMQEMLTVNAAGLDEAKRKALIKWITARAIDQSMLAMLARQEGNWRIVCMSFPKK